MPLLAGVSAVAGTWEDTNALPVVRMNAGEARAAVQRARSAGCLQNLKRIGLAVQLYANDHNDRPPLAWADFAHQSDLLAPTNLYCPADLDRPARDAWAEVDFQTLSYSLETPTWPAPASVVLARCRIHDNAVLTDGAVREARPYDTRVGPLLSEGRLLPPSATRGAAVEGQRRWDCRRNLRQLALAVRFFAGDHAETLPSSFSEITNELYSTRILFCPAETWNSAPVGFDEVNWAEVSYSLDAPGQPEEPIRRILTCRLHGSSADSSGATTLGTNWYPSPLIVGHPLSQTVRPGASAIFEVVTGEAAAGPARFQWRRVEPFDADGNPFTNAVELAGETNRVLERPHTTAADEGCYDVVVSDPRGRSQPSGIAFLHVAELETVTQVPGWREAACLNNLRQIAIAALLHHGAWNRMPDSLADTRSFLGWPTVLFCPSDSARVPPPDWTGLDAAQTSYTLAPGASAESTNLLATCRVHGFEIDSRGRFVDRPGSPLRSRLSALLSADRGAIVLSAQGLAGAYCLIESSTNLVNWQILGFDQLAAEPYVLTNRIAPANPASFFRARMP